MIIYYILFIITKISLETFEDYVSPNITHHYQTAQYCRDYLPGQISL